MARVGTGTSGNGNDREAGPACVRRTTVLPKRSLHARLYERRAAPPRPVAAPRPAISRALPEALLRIQYGAVLQI